MGSSRVGGCGAFLSEVLFGFSGFLLGLLVLFKQSSMLPVLAGCGISGSALGEFILALSFISFSIN